MSKVTLDLERDDLRKLLESISKALDHAEPKPCYNPPRQYVPGRDFEPANGASMSGSFGLADMKTVKGHPDQIWLWGMMFTDGGIRLLTRVLLFSRCPGCRQ